MPSTVAYYPVDSRGEKTTAQTGNTDLFSSVAEAQARADSKKWEAEQKLKESQADVERQRQEALNASRQAAEQIVAQIQAVIEELNGLSVKDGTTDERISSAQTMLETLNGTEFYEPLKAALDEAAARAANLPVKTGPDYSAPQEIGPGVTPGPAPGVSPGEAPGSAPVVTEPVTAEPDVQFIGPSGQ